MFKKVAALFVGAFAGLVAMVGSANAALDAGVSTAITGIQTDISALAGMVWPVLLLALGIAIAMKLTKRFGNKI